MTRLVCAAGLVLLGAAITTCQAADPPAADKNKPIEITAEDLGREYLKDGKTADNKYQGKLLRVSGEIGQVLSEMVYVKTSLRFETGQPVKFVLRFPREEDTKPYKAGQNITVEGKLGVTGVFGPSMKEFNVIKK